ncbi:putative holin-like toxin [Lactobacillus paracasei]|nr:putative holin-like toxin [Lacticaseibacillus paracasei]
MTKFFERRSTMSIYESLSLMIMFGLFILGLITLVLKLNDR